VFCFSRTRALYHPGNVELSHRRLQRLILFVEYLVLEKKFIRATLKSCAASHRVEASHFSFWDSLIIETARTAGAQRFYTEGLQSSQLIDQMEICNPFIAGK